jgi:transposase
MGKPVKDVARELGISEGVLYEWVRKADSQAAQLGSAGPQAPQERGELSVADELRRLRRENAHLKMENHILKKAAVILGTKTLPGDEP